MAYPCHNFFDFSTNILKCHTRRISKSQIFENVIRMGNLNHKYLYQGYPMDILYAIRRPD